MNNYVQKRAIYLQVFSYVQFYWKSIVKRDTRFMVSKIELIILPSTFRQISSYSYRSDWSIVAIKVYCEYG